MDKLKALEVFVAVADRQGFAAAARHLGMSTSAVSRYVIELEKDLGVQLFHRTTRRIELTDVGTSYLDRCIQIVSDVENLDDSTRSFQTGPTGEIKITASVFMGKSLLVPIIRDFLETHPDIKVTLLLLDRTVDLVDEGIDVAVRVGRLPDATYVARVLGIYKMVLAAAPGYLKRFGMPRTITELDKHNCLVDSVPRYFDRWPLMKGKGRVAKRVKGNFVVNDGEAVRDMAVGGLGVSFLPDFFVQKELDSNKLKPILTNSVTRQGEISIVYPPNRYASRRVRVFIDFIIENWPEKK